MRWKNNMFISLSFFFWLLYLNLVYVIISQGFVYACRSLRIGRVVRPAGYDSTASLLSGSCLKSLAYNHGFIGYWLDYQFDILISNFLLLSALSSLNLANGLKIEKWTCRSSVMVSIDRKELEQEKNPNTISPRPRSFKTHLFMVAYAVMPYAEKLKTKNQARDHSQEEILLFISWNLVNFLLLCIWKWLRISISSNIHIQWLCWFIFWEIIILFHHVCFIF